jgi:hypothetical protein
VVEEVRSRQVAPAEREQGLYQTVTALTARMAAKALAGAAVAGLTLAVAGFAGSAVVVAAAATTAVVAVVAVWAAAVAEAVVPQPFCLVTMRQFTPA